jgi:2-iminoacetate synthase ThiH
MIQAIREAGRVPVQRDTFYEPIRQRAGEEALAKA